MRLIYYSKNSALPALLAAIRHIEPDLAMIEGLKKAAAWWGEHQVKENSVILKEYGMAEDGTNIYVATSCAEPPLIERTLTGIYQQCSLQQGDALLIVSSLPAYRKAWNGVPEEAGDNSKELASLWRETGVAVKEARLQNMLQQVRP